MVRIKHVAMSAALLISVSAELNAVSGKNMGENTGEAMQTAQPMDRKFIMDAPAANLAEIKMGQLAKQRATNAEVKSFAQMMIDDHTKANNELAQIAQRMGVTPPKDVAPYHRAAMAGMSRLSGMEFDMAYIKGQLGDHALTLDLLEMQENSGKDPELRQFAARARPVVQKHYEIARELEEKMHTMAMKAGK
jgi:putative membrane protein